MEEVIILGELCRACLLKSNNMKNLSVTDDYSINLLKKLSSLCNLKEVCGDFVLIVFTTFSYFLG